MSPSFSVPAAAGVGELWFFPVPSIPWRCFTDPMSGNGHFGRSFLFPRVSQALPCVRAQCRAGEPANRTDREKRTCLSMVEDGNWMILKVLANLNHSTILWKSSTLFTVKACSGELGSALVMGREKPKVESLSSILIYCAAEIFDWAIRIIGILLIPSCYHCQDLRGSWEAHVFLGYESWMLRKPKGNEPAMNIAFDRKTMQ